MELERVRRILREKPHLTIITILSVILVIIIITILAIIIVRAQYCDPMSSPTSIQVPQVHSDDYLLSVDFKGYFESIIESDYSAMYYPLILQTVYHYPLSPGVQRFDLYFNCAKINIIRRGPDEYVDVELTLYRKRGKIVCKMSLNRGRTEQRYPCNDNGRTYGFLTAENFVILYYGP